MAELHDKIYGARVKAAYIFEKEHANMIRDFDFKLGDLVLIATRQSKKP
jgi:hypothetical protein